MPGHMLCARPRISACLLGAAWTLYMTVACCKPVLIPCPTGQPMRRKHGLQMYSQTFTVPLAYCFCPICPLSCRYWVDTFVWTRCHNLTDLQCVTISQGQSVTLLVHACRCARLLIKLSCQKHGCGWQLTSVTVFQTRPRAGVFWQMLLLRTATSS